MQRKSPKTQLALWVLLSALFHIGAGGLYFAIAAYESPFRDDRNIIEIKIVQKGKKRDEKLLPRQIQPEPMSDAPEISQKEIEPAPEPVATPVHKPVVEKHKVTTPEKPKKAPSERKNPLAALKDRLKELDKEGDPDGMDFGNSVVGELKESYLAGIQAALDRVKSVPAFLTEREKEILKVIINIQINEEGEPIHVRVVKASKNSAYDEFAVAKAMGIVTFGPPPIPLRKQLKKEGQSVAWCPVKCKD